MSLNSLAASRVAAQTRASKHRQTAVAASEDALGPDESDVQNALSALVEYVPAETVTLYLATIASLPAIAGTVTWLDAPFVYWLFAVLTPVLFALIYAGKRNAAGEPRCPGLRDWPWWPMVAATIAFLAWGLTVPDGPYVTDEGGRVLTALLAIFVSTLLGVAGRFFAPRGAS